MTMKDNLKYSKHKEIKGKKNTTNTTITMPSKYRLLTQFRTTMTALAVPISFLDKYNPDQFEILGVTQRNDDPYKIKKYTTADYLTLTT